MPLTSVSFDPRAIPALRRAAGLSSADLARRAGFRPDELSRFEQAIVPGGLMDCVLTTLCEALVEGEKDEGGTDGL